jgi:hypothetical protein
MTTSVENKYFVDSTLEQDDQGKWLILIDFAIESAEEIEFNILKKSNDYYAFIDDFKKDIIAQGKRKDKIYHTKEYIRLKKSEGLINYIRAKTYSSWYKNFLEDISFLKNGTEYFATITHENYVIIKMSESKRIELNKTGFNFEMEWPYPYDK